MTSVRRSRRRDQAGQGLFEYGIILSVVALVLIAVVGQIGNKTKVSLCQVSNGFANAGSIATFGDNGNAQLGNGSSSGGSTATPAAVSGVCSVAASAGFQHTLAVAPNGQIYTWGYNGDGALGQGTIVGSYPLPVQVTLAPLPANYNATQVAAGDMSVALIGGNVWAWGKNTVGQAGGPGNPNQLTPFQLTFTGIGANTITAIAAGYEHGLALDSSGAVWAWGNNSNDQLGTNLNNGTSSAAPARVCAVGGAAAANAGCTTYLTGIASIDGMLYSSLALTTTGNIIAWGDDSKAELGDNSTTTKVTAVAGNQGCLGSSNVKVIERGATNYHNLAILTDGTICAWGEDDYGELGIDAGCGAAGSGCYVGVPALVKGVGGVSTLQNAVSIARGAYFSLAVTGDGTVYGWGKNDLNQTGQPSGATTTYPTKVAGITKAKSINAGQGHAIVVINPGGTPIPSS